MPFASTVHLSLMKPRHNLFGKPSRLLVCCRGEPLRLTQWFSFYWQASEFAFFYLQLRRAFALDSIALFVSAIQEPFTADITAKDGTMVSKTTWRSHVMVWGHYELDVGDTLHFRIPDKQEVAMMAEVLGAGICGCKPPVETFDEPRWLHAKWDIRVPADHEALIHLRREVQEVQEGQAWKHILKALRGPPFEPRALSEEDRKILKHLMILHKLNTEQAHAVRLVLDGAPILPVSGNVGSGKTQTATACIKALIMQQGYHKASAPNMGGRIL